MGVISTRRQQTHRYLKPLSFIDQLPWLSRYILVSSHPMVTGCAISPVYACYTKCFIKNMGARRRHGMAPSRGMGTGLQQVIYHRRQNMIPPANFLCVQKHVVSKNDESTLILAA
jgi:hypothetical protein